MTNRSIQTSTSVERFKLIKKVADELGITVEILAHEGQIVETHDNPRYTVPPGAYYIRLTRPQHMKNFATFWENLKKLED